MYDLPVGERYETTSGRVGWAFGRIFGTVALAILEAVRFVAITAIALVMIFTFFAAAAFGWGFGGSLSWELNEVLFPDDYYLEEDTLDLGKEEHDL